VTERSKRRAAELAVIEAANHLYDVGPRGGAVDMISAVKATMELCNRVEELRDLGLADPGRARANKGAPVTAQQAAIWMNGDKARGWCARIVRLLYRYGGMTTEEIERTLQGKHQTVSPRVTELRDAGWIYDSGHRRKTSSTNEAIVWWISHAARQAINGQEGML
jgi:hypothetical protein